nr:hypothetical protein [Tanacetum cinerariifolium]
PRGHTWLICGSTWQPDPLTQPLTGFIDHWWSGGGPRWSEVLGTRVWFGYEVTGSVGGSAGSLTGLGGSEVGLDTRANNGMFWEHTCYTMIGGSSCKKLAYDERMPKPIIGINEAVGGCVITKYP